jgi:riboflavin biosynthesis pyrimidine reductase
MRFLILLPLLLLPGCIGIGGYQVGSRSLFGSDIQTVYVPMVEADPTRRHLAERLTEAISKRIEERSPYKVVGRSSADSVLECRIVDKKQRVSLVDPSNDPRQKRDELTLEVRWRDRRSQDIRLDSFAWNDGTTQIAANEAIVAEYGQSLLTAEQRQIDRIASQIVGIMESPW